MALLNFRTKIQNGSFDKENILRFEYKIPNYILKNYEASELDDLIRNIPTNPWKCYSKNKAFSIKLCKELAAKFSVNLPDEKDKAYLKYALDKVSEQGHTFMFRHQVDYWLKNDNINIDKAIAALEEEKFLKYYKKKIYPYAAYNSENAISRKLQKLNSYNGLKTGFICYNSISPHYAKLNQKQQDVVLSIENNKLVILTGLPGTGKTTTVQAIVDCYGENSVELFAPTGKAAIRMSTLCNIEARTLHSGFGLKNNVVSDKIVIIDEMSMCDVEIGGSAFDGIDESCTVVIVGDPDQLPSVGPGQVLKDILDSGIGVRYHLDTVMRQKPGSILRSAHAIHAGKELVIGEDKEVLIYSPKDWDLKKIATAILSDPNWIDAQFLSVLREKCSSVINPFIRDIINPSVTQDKWRVGDKVIQTRNNKDLGVFNGEIGTIVGVQSNVITVDYNGKLVYYSAYDTFDIDHAYCITVHKSQGSEFDKVVFIVNKSRITTRNLLYTGLTRAKSKIMIVCEDTDDVLDAIDNINSPRQTLLKTLISKEK